MTVMVKVRQPNTIPYFWAMGRSRRPKAARMSVGEVMEVMVEKAWRSLSRSDSSVVVDDMVVCFGLVFGMRAKLWHCAVIVGGRRESGDGR